MNVQRIGPDAIEIARCDGEEDWLFARNTRYAFWLERKKDQGWTIRELHSTPELQASCMVSRYLRRCFFPDFLHRQDSLLDAINKPYFKLISIQHESTDDYPLLYRVTFDYEHPYQASQGDYQYNWVQNGTLWLDADNCWVMVRSEVEYLGAGGKRSLHALAFDFGPANEEGIRLPSRRMDYDDLPSNWDTEGEEVHVLDYEQISTQQFDSRQLTLSHYGFAEPVFDSGTTKGIIDISMHDHQATFGVNEGGKFSFSVRNITDVEISIVSVLAC